MAVLDHETIETFRRDGVAVLRGVVDAAWRDRLAEAIEDNMASPGPHGKNHADDGGGAYFGDYVNWQRFGAFRDIGADGGLGRIAGELMGSRKVQLFHEHVLVKEPGNSSATPWHQDLPYYCLDGSQTVSLWVPLDPVAKNVCPHFLAGSHEGQTTYVPRRFKTLKPLEGDTSTYKPFPDIDEERDVENLRSFDLEPGDAIAFDYHTLHNAPPNTASTRRRAVSLRYVGEDVRFVDRPHELSPPFTEMGLELAMGDQLPEDWFPTVWQSASA
ncbi:MAG: phytanoyl-CoA dioxygenase family protein [Pseudomonadota bacterium]